MKRTGVLFCCMISLVACTRETQHQAQGYVEGRYTYIASNVSGILKEISVERGTQVKRGDPLYELDAQPESDSYEEALQNLKQAVSERESKVAALAFAKVTYERYQKLVVEKAIQKSQLDDAKSKFDSLIAELKGADSNIEAKQALLRKANWSQDQKHPIAPIDAQVFDTYYRVGENTVANQPVLSLLAPEDIRVIFYVEEPELSRLKLGAPVTVNCDECKKPFTGKIRFISPSAEYTPPVIYSTETNYKFIYRVEAGFEAKDAKLLHPGQPVSVQYRVSA